MAIVCRGCGIQYDVGLFQFGRTIDCTCGARVGLGAEIRAGGEERCEVSSERGAGEGGRGLLFVADAMLAGLARRLRMLGYDTVCEPALRDADLVRRCYEEGRILLTCDRGIPGRWRVPELVLLECDKPLMQLAELARRYELGRGARPFTRCSRCNVEVVAVDGDEVRGAVPEGLWAKWANADAAVERVVCGGVERALCGGVERADPAGVGREGRSAMAVGAERDQGGITEREREGSVAAPRRFLRCPACKRVYWEGSHTRRMRRILGRALGCELPRPEIPD